MKLRIRTILAIAMACMLSACLSVPALADESASQVASSDEYGGRETVSTDGMVPVSGSEVADGTYSILVETDTQMFNIIDCQLTVEDGVMSAVITLSGDGYRWVYMGTGEEAASSDASEYIEYVEDERGRYTYDIGEIESLNTAVKCCCYSKRREQWYDHDIIFVAGTLPTDALSPEAQQAVRDSSPLSGLPDGEYQIAVDVFGGDDTVENPAPLTIADGEATATLRFSSPNYESLTMTGETFEPVEVVDGSAVFEFPVKVFDSAIPVTFSSTASGEPQESNGSLSFHSGQVTDAEGNPVAAAEAAGAVDDGSAAAEAPVSDDSQPGRSVPIAAIVVVVLALCVVAGVVIFKRGSRAGEGGN